MASQPVTCDITLIGAGDNTRQINLNVDEPGLEGLLETDTKSDLNVSSYDLSGVFLVKFGSSGVLDEATEFAVDASSLKIHGITQYTEITKGAKVQNGKSITEDSIDMLSQRHFGNPALAKPLFKNYNEIKYSFDVETEHNLLDSLRANLRDNGGSISSPLAYSDTNNNYTKQILESANGQTLIDRIKSMPDYQDGSWNSVIFKDGDKLSISVAIGFANNLNTTNQLPQSVDNALLQNVQSIADGWQTIDSVGNPITPSGPQSVSNYNSNNPDFYRLHRVSLNIVTNSVVTGQPYTVINTGGDNSLTVENIPIALTDNEVVNAPYIPSELTSTPPPEGKVTIIFNQPNWIPQEQFNDAGSPTVVTVDGSGNTLQTYHIMSRKDNFFVWTIDKPTYSWFIGVINYGPITDPLKYNTSKPFNQFYFIGYISQQQINDCKICTTLGVPVTADLHDGLLTLDSRLGSVNLVDQDVYNCPYIETSLKDLSAVFTAFYSLPSYISQEYLNNYLGTPGMWIDMSLNPADVLKPDYIDQENNVLAWTLDFVPDRIVFGASQDGPKLGKWEIKQSDISFNRYAAVLYRNANDDIPKPYSTLFDNTLNFYVIAPNIIDYNSNYGTQNLYILGKATTANDMSGVTFKFDISGNPSDISYSSLINGVAASLSVQTDGSGVQTGLLTYSWTDVDLSGLISDSAWTKLGVLDDTTENFLVSLDSNDPNLYLNGFDASNGLYFTSRYSDLTICDRCFSNGYNYYSPPPVDLNSDNNRNIATEILVDDVVLNTPYLSALVSSKPQDTVRIMVDGPSYVYNDSNKFDELGLPVIIAKDASGIPTILKATGEINDIFYIDVPANNDFVEFGLSSSVYARYNYVFPTKGSSGASWHPMPQQFWFNGYISLAELNQCNTCTSKGEPMVINPTATDPLEGAAGAAWPAWSMFVDDAVLKASFIPDSLKGISAEFIYIFNIPNYYPNNYFSQDNMDNWFGTPALWINDETELSKGLRPDYIDQSTNFVAWALDFVPDSVVTGPLLIGPFWSKWPTRQSDTSFNKYVCVTNQPSPNAMIPNPYSPVFDDTINIYLTNNTAGTNNVYMLADSSAIEDIDNSSVKIVVSVSGELVPAPTSDISGLTASSDVSGNLTTYAWSWNNLTDLSMVNTTSWTLLGTFNLNGIEGTKIETAIVSGVSSENVYFNAERLDNNEFYTNRYVSNI